MNMLENTGHLWSPFHAFMDEQVDVAGADTPLGTELCGREFARRDPAAYRRTETTGDANDYASNRSGGAQSDDDATSPTKPEKEQH